MVKALLSLLIVLSLAADPYTQNCIPCHQKVSLPLEKLYFDYLLKHSSESRVKKALYDYLISPSQEKSILQKSHIQKHGIKQPTTLRSKDLQNAINTYWQTYTVLGKLH